MSLEMCFLISSIADESISIIIGLHFFTICFVSAPSPGPISIICESF